MHREGRLSKDSFRFVDNDCFRVFLIDMVNPEKPSAMNKIVRMIHKNRRLRDQIIAACEEDGEPLTPQAINAWKQLRKGVPAARVQTVSRVLGLKAHVIRPDIFPPGM